jgi:hypothetical protein
MAIYKHKGKRIKQGAILPDGKCIQYRMKRTLHFQNDTENKNGVFINSHPHQSTEKKNSHNLTWNHPVKSPFMLGARNSSRRCAIAKATAPIIMDTMHKIWDKLDYRLDICSVIHRPHIESL